MRSSDLMPTTLTGWLTTLRTRRRSGVAHTLLLAALADVVARLTVIQAAVTVAGSTCDESLEGAGTGSCDDACCR